MSQRDKLDKLVEDYKKAIKRQLKTRDKAREEKKP